MYHRIVRLFVLFASALFLLLTSNTTAFSAAPSPIQQDTPVNVPLDADALEQFWQELYPSAGSIGTANNTNVYASELLAKATPDECFNGIGADESADPVPDCPNGQPKVNEAYVWGMTPYEETIWFGTAPNVHCLVMGAYLGSTAPTVTDSYTCEFGAGPNPTLNVNAPAIGDWRSPKLYIYDNAAKELVDVSPNGSTGYIRDTRFVSTTLGIRSAATFGDYVFFAGPALLPSGSINIFLYDAASRAYLGSYNLTGYNNIRKWLVVDDVLYTAVGKASGGAVLRYTGDPSSATLADRFQFEEVGLLDADGAELALHDGRIFVNTWPSGLGSVVAGLYMSPVVPDGGLTNADAGGWVKVFSYDEYEPDPVVARTYGGGALYSYGGDLFWGTMHVPFLATRVHLGYYSAFYDTYPEAIPAALLGNQRSITIFQGRNFGTPDQAVEVAYGLSELPVFNADNGDFTWQLRPNNLGVMPKYGPSGFDNMFNNYTWSMAEYDGQLFVGTMDWSYLLHDILQTFIETPLDSLELPIDIDITLPDAVLGADLYRFYSTDAAALPESLDGVGNYSSYGIRNMVGREDALYLGMANPMNLLTDLADDKPEGGWELISLQRHLVPLTVTVAGNGGGSVVSDPAGISCGVTCTLELDYATTVVLTPTADISSTFTGWSGACSGTDLCTVTLTEATQVTATFTTKRFPLIVNIVGGGSGNVVSTPPGMGCSQPSCSADFDLGTQLELSAVAFGGSSFEGWSGACSGLAACEVTIDGPNVVTATFVQNPQQATIQVEGEPRVGSPITLTATLSMSPIDECTWNFGDGTTESCDGSPEAGTATVQAVQDITIQATHVYTQAGTYVVTVAATNDAGTVVAAQEITVEVPTAEPPVAAPQRPGELYLPYMNR